MQVARRWYIYLIAAISLQTVGWSVVHLGRVLFTSLEIDVVQGAFETAAIVVGLVIFLFHWLWGQRGITQNEEERFAVQRYLYLYIMLALFAIYGLASLFSFLQALAYALFGLPFDEFWGVPVLQAGERLISEGWALLVWGVLASYHIFILRQDDPYRKKGQLDTQFLRAFLNFFMVVGLGMLSTGLYQLLVALARTAAESGYSNVTQDLINSALLLLIGAGVWTPLWHTIQTIFITPTQRAISNEWSTLFRLGLYLVCAMGLAILVQGVWYNLAWVLSTLTGSYYTQYSSWEFANSVGQVVVGLFVWGIYWRAAQQIYGLHQNEQKSAIRRLYLYVIIFLGTGNVVGSLTLLLAGFLRQVLGLPSTGGLEPILANIIVGGVVWAYHAYVLHQDAQKLPAEEPDQAEIRRLYLYLVAGIGLTSLLIGLGGEIGVIIFTLGDAFDNDSREAMAWFTAALISGLGVWFVPWYRVQGMVGQNNPAGRAEQQSGIRKLYLYLFIFAATLTVFATSITLLAQIIITFVGTAEDSVPFRTISLAMAYLLMGFGVLAYHGYLLRLDQQVEDAEEAKGLKALLVVLLAEPENSLAKQLVETLKEKLPAVRVQQFGPDQFGLDEQLPAVLAEANLLIAFADLLFSPQYAPLMAALEASAGKKLLLPSHPAGWHWVGLRQLNPDQTVNACVQQIKQMALGQSGGSWFSFGTIAMFLIGGALSCIALMVLWVLFIEFVLY